LVHYRTSKVSTVTLQESIVIRNTTTNRLALFSALVAVPFLGITAANAQVTLDKNVTVSGQGSSFVSNFMEQCKSDAKNEFGINIAYQPTGSGAGRTAYLAGTNDFGGSDVAFPPAEKDASSKKPFVYIPVAVGGVAIIYKVPGVTDLKLSGPTLAGIFSGKIQSWNNEAIARDNPGASLPNEVIRVVVRSDSSGTSNVFSDYLATAGGGTWKGGATSNFPVPAGNGIAQRGSDGVSNYVAGPQGNFAITYAETSFAEERKLTVAKVINTARQAVSPDAAGVTDAMAGAAVNDDGSLLLNFNVASPKAYPISTTAYLIAPQQMDKAKGDVLRTFLTYALTTCQEKATKVGYAPLPENITKLGLAAVDKINPGSGAVPTAKAAAPVASTATTTAAPTTVAPATTAAPTTKAAPTETSKKKKISKKTTKKK
jgi:phosphate transport system substrate-binding protein